MSSAILRFEKAHNATEVGHRLSHNTRTKEVKNAIKERQHLNKVFNYCEDIKQRIKDVEKLHKQTTGRKVRKDAVRVVEAVITSDSKFFKNKSNDEILKFFKDSEDWLRKIFGNENMLQCAVHMDEKTPHAHYLLTPVREGQLNCKAIMNGKNAIRGLQNDFHKHVEHWGLERGELVEFTKAKHQRSKDFAHDVDKKAKYLQELNEEERDNYAIKGIQAEEEIMELKEHIEVIEEENAELNDKANRYKEAYDTLALGVMSCIKGNEVQKQKQVKDIYHLGYAKKMELKKEKNDDLEL
ncbi:MobV family relaxase [Clostridium perfringens]|uniref:MobV family relaxase n=1 Tax=Clostridium perfringens TaxID=1502 RepID=UPI0039E83AB4